MKLIWLSHFIPFPPRGGASQRSFNLLREAARGNDVTFIAFNRPEQRGAMLEESRQTLIQFCSQVFFWELPFPWKGARWWANLCTSPLHRHPLSIQAYASRELLCVWSRILEAVSPDLIHIDSGDLAYFIEPALRFPTVLNHHNCESAMAARRASLEPNPIKRAVLHSQAARLTAVESSVISRVALNLAVSGEDRDRLRAINPEAKVTVIDNGTDTEFFRPREDLAEENTIVFASSLRWYPNLSGLEFFDREIWPEIKRRCPGVRFIVAGQAPPPHLVRWAKQDAAIDFVPNPEDIRPQIARGAVYVCPIVDGGGSRLKLLDAMAMGKAIVSTEVGAEGLHYVEGHEMLVAKTPSLFAEYVIQLLGDSGRRKLMSIAARERSMAEYSWPVIGARLAQSYAVAVLARPTRQEHGPAIASAGHRL